MEYDGRSVTGWLFVCQWGGVCSLETNRSRRCRKKNTQSIWCCLYRDCLFRVLLLPLSFFFNRFRKLVDYGTKIIIYIKWILTGLPQFLLATVNCSLPTAPRNLLKGEVGVVSRHQWFHAVGHSLDDLRIHWNFPGSPGVCLCLSLSLSDQLRPLSVSHQSEDTSHTLRREFEQKAWKAIGGKYAHRVFGYLLPPETGSEFD